MNSASRWLLSLVFLVALQAQLQSILSEMHVPGVSVAIVRKEGPEWVGAIGLENVERREAGRLPCLAGFSTLRPCTGAR